MMMLVLAFLFSSILSLKADSLVEILPIPERCTVSGVAVHHRLSSLTITSDQEMVWRLTAPPDSNLSRAPFTSREWVLKPDVIGGYRLRGVSRSGETFETRFIATEKPTFKRTGVELHSANQKHLRALQKPPESLGGEGVVLAFLDTGVDYLHPSLHANILQKNGRLIGRDFIFGDHLPYDDHGHGTFLASLAASSTFGIAPRAKILPVKVVDAFGETNAAVLAKALLWAVDQDVQIVMLPLDFARLAATDPLKEAFLQAKKKNVLLVIAAGNQTQDLDQEPLEFLQDSHVVTVGASCGERLAPYSNYGARTVSVIAAGGIASSPFQGAALEKTSRDGYGTSAAAALVAGTAALGFSLVKEPHLIKQALLRAGPRLDSMKGKSVSERVLTVPGFLEELHRLIK